MTSFLDWYATEGGQGCSKDDVITNKDDCLIASNQLGFACGNCDHADKIEDLPKRPPGCYFQNSLKSWYNGLASTKDLLPKQVGGICRHSSTMI